MCGTRRVMTPSPFRLNMELDLQSLFGLHVHSWDPAIGSSDFGIFLENQYASFMCFWFGLEILRLVYKKVFFEILNGFYLIWPFILRKKQHRPL